GTCKPKDGCPEGTVPIGDGVCRPPSGCPEGTVSIGDGVCRPPRRWPEGTVPIGDGVCRPPGGDGPKLKVEKAIASCCNISNDGAQIAKCSFRVTVTNIGTTPYSGEVTWGDNDPNNLSPNGASHSAQVTLAPGQTQAIGEANQFYTPGTRYSNCVALGRRQPVNSGTPGPDLFCISGNVPVPRCNVPRRRTGGFLLPALRAREEVSAAYASLSIRGRQAAVRAAVSAARHAIPVGLSARPRP